MGVKGAGQLLGKLDAGGGLNELAKFILVQAAEHLAPEYRLTG